MSAHIEFMALLKRTWVLAANRSGADIYDHLGAGKGLRLIEHLDHAQGRLKNSEIDSDQPGMVFESHGSGSHAMSKEENAHDRVAANFSRLLGDRLRQARAQASFDQLILVAEPKFLGMLRQALDHPTSALVSASVGKDIVGAGESVVARHVATHLAV